MTLSRQTAKRLIKVAEDMEWELGRVLSACADQEIKDSYAEWPRIIKRSERARARASAELAAKPAAKARGGA